jgi:hypothetical protein
MTTINYQGRQIRLGKHMAAALKFGLHFPENKVPCSRIWVIA